MHSLLDVLNKTTAFFEKKGIENPRLNGELIFAYALKCKRLELYLQFDRLLEEEILSKIRPLVKRRAKLEPLQYIIGEMEFCDLKIKVDSRALIPRPETECLIEVVLNQLETPPARILDLGTGCGVIAMVLAKRFGNAEVLAVDKSSSALSLAGENIGMLDLEKNIHLVKSDWFEAVSGSYDLIISNPPYLTEREWETAQAEVREYEPEMALLASEEGISDLRTILVNAKRYLRPGGIVALETGVEHKEMLVEIAGKEAYKHFESFKDWNDRHRFFLAWN